MIIWRKEVNLVVINISVVGVILIKFLYQTIVPSNLVIYCHQLPTDIYNILAIPGSQVCQPMFHIPLEGGEWNKCRGLCCLLHGWF